jgi:hypothetical protein
VDVAFNDIEADLKTLSLRGRRRKALDRDKWMICWRRAVAPLMIVANFGLLFRNLLKGTEENHLDALFVI